jgi:head-tail adaptor
MDARVTIARRVDVSGRQFGDGGERYEIVGDRWAWATFNKGMKSLREGVMDAYDTVMFRMDYHADIDRWCLIKYHGRWYQIMSFNANYHTNEMQITAQELANQQVNIEL